MTDDQAKHETEAEDEVGGSSEGYQPFDANLYFKQENWFWKLLRSLNMLEPGRPVISISKSYMWLSFFITMFMFGACIFMFLTGTGIGESETLMDLVQNLGTVIVSILGAVTNMFNATANYRHRRDVMYLKTKGYTENFSDVS